jgi:hypothetical protein
VTTVGAVIDFELEPEQVELRERVAEFVREVAIPAEPRDVGGHGTDDGLRAELWSIARRQLRVRAAGAAPPAPRS